MLEGRENLGGEEGERGKRGKRGERIREGRGGEGREKKGGPRGGPHRRIMRHRSVKSDRHGLISPQGNIDKPGWTLRSAFAVERKQKMQTSSHRLTSLLKTGGGWTNTRGCANGRNTIDGRSV